MRIELSDLEVWLKEGYLIVNEGSPPRGKEWRDLKDKYPHLIVFHEPESANRDLQAIREAIELTNRPINPARLKVFDALPRETKMLEGFQERERMGIGGSQEYWNDLHRQIRARSEKVQQVEATRKAVLEELRAGTSDVLMLYAHSDGEHLIMPGMNGGMIGIEELTQIDRTNDSSVRERLILLVACRAGARTITMQAATSNSNATPPHTEVRRSLASVLLQNGIGRAVMATDHAYDSREIPALVDRLLSGMPVRKAVSQTPSRSNLSPRVELLPPAAPIPGVPGQVDARPATGL